MKKYEIRFFKKFQILILSDMYADLGGVIMWFSFFSVTSTWPLKLTSKLVKVHFLNFICQLLGN